MRLMVSAFLFSLCSSLSVAGEADVVNVDVRADGNRYTFSVTVQHADEGWDHYADRWDVVGTDGTVYGERILAHPHVNEQPFTRSATIDIPAGVTSVIIRANDSVHGLGGKEIVVPLQVESNF